MSSWTVETFAIPTTASYFSHSKPLLHTYATPRCCDKSSRFLFKTEVLISSAGELTAESLPQQCLAQGHALPAV